MNTPRLLLKYDPSVFHELYDFHIARTILEQLGPVVTALGDIVCNYGLHDAVAANLLHKHFEIADDERIVREYDGRIAYMKPHLRSEPLHGEMEILPYLWQYADGAEGRHFYPLEFAEYFDEEIPNAIAEIERIQSSQEFLRQCGQRLWQLGLEDVFGIAALCSRKNVVLHDGEAMLESTDTVNRVLTLEPVLESELGDHDTTETLWTFTPPEATTAQQLA